MKKWNLKYLLAAAALVPSLASALDERAKEELDFKLSLQSKNVDGLEIRPVSRKYIEDALKKVGGKGQVEFKSGGVIIGSGADGLVATSNKSSKGGAIVVPAPVVAETSITVVGRPGSYGGRSQGDNVCATSLRADKQGNLLPGTQAEACVRLGTPLRLNAGKVILAFSNSFMLVDLKAGDKKIIPLREVSIPKYQGYRVEYSVTREFCAPLELRKRAAILLSDASIGSKATLNSMLNYLDQFKRGDSTWCDRAYVGLTAHGSDGTFFSVLPGTYHISWNIDGQQAPPTRNLVIE